MRIPTTAIALAAAFLQPVAQANDGETAPLPRLVWAGEDVSSLGAPTRDGRMLTIVDKRSGDLAFRSLLDGATKRITHSASSGEFSYFSVPSRDGNRLAYAWFNDEGFYELRVTDADSPGTARTVYKNPEAGFVSVFSLLTYEPIGIALPANDAQFINWTTNFLDRMDGTDTLKGLGKVWFGENMLQR